MKFTTLPLDQIYKFKKQDLQPIEIQQDKYALMRALSYSLFLTQKYYKNIQNLCQNLLKSIIKQNKGYQMSYQLQELIDNVCLLSDYFEDPYRSSEDIFNLELLGMLFQSKIIVYSYGYDNILKEKILYSYNDQNIIQLVQYQQNYYPIAIDKDYSQNVAKNSDTIKIDTEQISKRYIIKKNNRSYSLNTQSTNTNKNCFKTQIIHTPEYNLLKQKKTQKNHIFGKKGLKLKKNNSQNDEIRVKVNTQQLNTKYSNNIAQAEEKSPLYSATTQSSNSNYFNFSNCNITQKNFVKKTQNEKPPGIGGYLSFSRSRQNSNSSMISNSRSKSPTNYQQSPLKISKFATQQQEKSVNESENQSNSQGDQDYIIDHSENQNQVRTGAQSIFSPKLQPGRQNFEFDMSPRLKSKTTANSLGFSGNNIKRGMNIQQNPVILDDSEGIFRGKLKFFDENGKFGFIIKDVENIDVFVHLDDLIQTGIQIEKLKDMKNHPQYYIEFTQMSYIGKYNKSKKAVQLKWINEDEHIQFHKLQKEKEDKEKIVSDSDTVQTTITA